MPRRAANASGEMHESFFNDEPHCLLWNRLVALPMIYHICMDFAAIDVVRQSLQDQTDRFLCIVCSHTCPFGISIRVHRKLQNGT